MGRPRRDHPEAARIGSLLGLGRSPSYAGVAEVGGTACGHRLWAHGAGERGSRRSEALPAGAYPAAAARRAEALASLRTRWYYGPHGQQTLRAPAASPGTSYEPPVYHSTRPEPLAASRERGRSSGQGPCSRRERRRGPAAGSCRRCRCSWPGNAPQERLTIDQAPRGSFLA
jgi:hypothetical protein